MAAQITQETFDSVVRENMTEFEMDVEEALNDAIQQFEAQGVNLANIVQDVSLYSGGEDGATDVQHPVVTAVIDLQRETKPDAKPETVKKISHVIQTECDSDLARRCLAGKNNAYPVLLAACKTFQSDQERLVPVLQALCSLCNGQPDLLDEEGILWNCQRMETTVGPTNSQGPSGVTAESTVVRKEEDVKVEENGPSDSAVTSQEVEIVALFVRLMKLNCVKHETNRQKYVASDIVALLSSTLDHYNSNSSVLKEVCGALRVLTYDDDVRVPFGKGHEHAKMIVTEQNALSKIMRICNDFREDGTVLMELYQTLSCLAVRNEFCQEIMDLGGVKLMIETIAHNSQNQGLMKQVLGVIKTISGNDQVKVAIVAASGIELIVGAMNKHARCAPIAEMGCAALTSLALRNPDHSDRIVAAGGTETIVKAMQLHPDKSAVQKQACLAVRNVVARRREHGRELVELGVEELIRRAMRDHPETCGDEGRAALRDLELQVELRELWTGEGRGIQA